MSEGKKPPPKHWHFWRAGFWTRPALIVVYSILAGVGGLLLLSTVPGNIADARTMLGARECSVPGQTRCLERISAVAEGPFHRRGPGSEWHVYAADGGRFLGDADLSTTDSVKLDEGDRVDVLRWEGEIVAVFTADGERIEAEAFGHGGWISPLGLGLFGISGAVVGIQMARTKRMGALSWWSTSSETSGPFLPPTSGNLLTGVIMFGAASAPLAMALGLPAVAAGFLTVCVTAGLAGLVMRRKRRNRTDS